MQPFRDQAVSRQRPAALQPCTEMLDALQIKCKSACLLGSQPVPGSNLALYWKHTTFLVYIPQMPVISSRKYQIKDWPQWRRHHPREGDFDLSKQLLNPIF